MKIDDVGVLIPSWRCTKHNHRRGWTEMRPEKRALHRRCWCLRFALLHKQQAETSERGCARRRSTCIKSGSFFPNSAVRKQTFVQKVIKDPKMLPRTSGF